MSVKRSIGCAIVGVAFAVAAAGCGYSAAIERSESPPEAARVHEPLPGTAVCEPDVREVLVERGLFREIRARAKPIQREGTGEARRTWGSAPFLAQGHLTLAVGEVLLDVRAAHVHRWQVELAQGYSGFTIASILLPFLAPMSVDLEPLEAKYELRCVAPSGDVLAQVLTEVTVGVSGKGWFELDYDRHKRCLDEASAIARTKAIEVLAAKLQADAPAHARIREALRSGVAAEPTLLPRPDRAGAPSVVEKPEPRPPVPPDDRKKLAPPTGRTFILVVGVNDYDDPTVPDLAFAEADARAVHRFFATEKRSPTDGDRVEVLLGKEATRINILKAVRERLGEHATEPGDTVVFFFSGHGFKDAHETYLAGRDAKIATLPETAIPLSALRSLWERIRAGRKVFISDACHSGGIADLRGVGGVALSPGGADPGVTATIASTGEAELATENRELGQGIFTLALLNGLRCDADRDGDGCVTLGEIEPYLVREVPSLAARAGGKQTPVIHSPPGAESIVLSRARE